MISNKCVRERYNQEDIMVDLARIRWNWLGHVMRKPASSITEEALYWTPTETRKRGRPRLMWQRSVKKELRERMTLTWGEAAKIAQDRERWRDLVH